MSRAKQICSRRCEQKEFFIIFVSKVAGKNELNFASNVVSKKCLPTFAIKVATKKVTFCESKDLKWRVYRKTKIEESTLCSKTTARWRARSARHQKPCTEQLISVRALIFSWSHLHTGLAITTILLQNHCSRKYIHVCTVCVYHSGVVSIVQLLLAIYCKVFQYRHIRMINTYFLCFWFKIFCAVGF